VSELTFSIMSTMKRVVVILSAVLYFGNPVTFQSVLGMALAVRFSSPVVELYGLSC
jgi:hypothetical protein